MSIVRGYSDFGRRYFSMGSSKLTIPRFTISANNAAVNVFVREPISKIVSPFTFVYLL